MWIKINNNNIKNLKISNGVSSIYFILKEKYDNFLKMDHALLRNARNTEISCDGKWGWDVTINVF